MNERSEELILVDQRDAVIGYAGKGECHDGAGLLHRAFSVFVFNSKGLLLMQKRAAAKRLWPGFWSNSCCSHPRRGENIPAAARRRVREELGLSVEVSFLYKFEYQARYAEAGSENELCWVLLARSDDSVSIDPGEVAEWKFVSPGEVDEQVASNPEHYAPWFKMEWAAIRDRHWITVEQLLGL